ncbi:MAG: DUF4258 domain-containing protein [Syntrophobacteraceae bacterium]
MTQSDKARIEMVIRALAGDRALKFTIHAHQEMVEEDITTSELLSSLADCILLEDYPDHKRGACCLVCGKTKNGRYLHTVCTYGYPEAIIITTYEPKPPKWETAFKRRMKQ